MSNPQDSSDTPTAALAQEIWDVWGEYDDFQHGGFPYVCFVIEQDLRDIQNRHEDDGWYVENAVEELADICINAMRMMLEQGRLPDEEIRDRLENHREKGQEDIIERYQAWYEKHREESEMYP